MEILTISEIEPSPTPLGGKARILVDNPELKMVNLIIDPGQRVNTHAAPVDVVFIVLDGKGQVTVEDEEIEVVSGQMLVCPAGTLRSIDAAADGGLNLLVVRCPNL